jgi:peptidoglycan/LPS O-acetylase OafA/YrhL
MTRRVHYIDWLRVLAVALLVPFHSARVFDGFEPFYAKNAVTGGLFDTFVMVVSFWHMPLLFLLAGASTYFALAKRDGRGYLRERVLRLLVPFAFGLLLIVPPQGWFGAMTNAGYKGSLPAYWPSFFIPRGDLSGYFGTITPAHLWFILYLFVISAAALPLVHWWRGPGEAGATSMSAALARPWAWVLAVLTLMTASALPALGGQNPFYYLVWFLFGYLLMMTPAPCETCERQRWWLLAAAASATVAAAMLYPVAGSLPRFSPGDVGFAFLRFGVGWLSVLAILGFGKRYLDRPSRALSYTAEASYPFYILHQTVIVAVAFYIVRLPWATAPKFVAIMAAATALTLAGYEVVRRVPALRFLFGMKPKRKLAAAPETAAA